MFYYDEKDVERYLINDFDEVLYFKNRKAINSFIRENKIKAEKEVCCFNFEILKNIKLKNNIPYTEILDLWNFFSDISNTLELEFIGDKKNYTTKNIYKKIFLSSNIFINDKGYKAKFTIAEKKYLAKIMFAGLEVFRRIIF